MISPVDIEKAIEQLRSECLVMEEIGRQFTEKCSKVRLALDKMHRSVTPKKKPALSVEVQAAIRARLRKKIHKKGIAKS